MRGRAATTSAQRYLDQLAHHLGELATGHEHGGSGLRLRSIERPVGGRAILVLDGGSCELAAGPESLDLAISADPATAEHLRRMLGERIETIGRRDGLEVVWEPTPRDAATVMAELLTQEGREDPFPRYAELHAVGPATRLGEASWVLNGYDAVNGALRDTALGFPDAPDDTGTTALSAMGSSILRANPPDHGRMRALMSSVFTPRRVVGLTPLIERTVEVLLEELPASGSFDFMEQVAFPLPISVICALLGVPREDRARFRPLAADLTEALELADGDEPTPAAAAAAEELTAYFADLVEQRRATPSDDLVGALVAARDAGDARLTDRELLANLVMLLVAGFETTTNLLGNGMVLLLDRPDLAAALSEGIVDIEDFVEEVLRFDSPVQATTRVVLTDTHIGEVEIPRGSGVLLLIGAANRDPARYPDPDDFDPTRPSIRPLSFGAGPHICLGNQLARLEATIAFRRILAAGLTGAAIVGRKRRDRLVLRGYESLVLVRPAASSRDPERRR